MYCHFLRRNRCAEQVLSNHNLRTKPMGEEDKQAPSAPASPAPAASPPADLTLPPPKFDPSRMIGIIRRKALIKDLAAVHHAECLSYCQELLDLQRKWEESLAESKVVEGPRKDLIRPAKRSKKAR